MSWSDIHRYCLTYADSNRLDYALIHQLLLFTEEALYTPTGVSPLHLSANGQCSRLLQYFLLQDVCPMDVNDRTLTDETTPLHWACRNGVVTSVNFLIHRGGDVHAVDWEKNTPLHYAVEGLNYDVVRFLLLRADIGRSLAVRNLSGLSPYDVALEEGDETMLSIFQNIMQHQVYRLPDSAALKEQLTGIAQTA